MSYWSIYLPPQPKNSVGVQARADTDTVPEIKKFVKLLRHYFIKDCIREI